MYSFIMIHNVTRQASSENADSNLLKPMHGQGGGHNRGLSFTQVEMGKNLLESSSQEQQGPDKSFHYANMPRQCRFKFLQIITPGVGLNHNTDSKLRWEYVEK